MSKPAAAERQPERTSAAEPPAVPAALAPVPPPEPPPPPPRIVRPLPVANCRAINSSEGVFGNIWGAIVPIGTTLEDMMTDTFWSNVCGQWRKNDRLWVVHQSDDYYDEFLVRKVWTVAAASSLPNRAMVQLLVRHELKHTEAGVDITAFTVSYQGPRDEWCVIRRRDMTVMHRGLDYKGAEEARRLAAEAMAAKPVRHGG